MLVDSERMISKYLTKYVYDPFQSHSSKRIDRFYLCLDEEIANVMEPEDINCVLIISDMSSHRRRSFIRFYEVYLFRIYSIKKLFHMNRILDWNDIIGFVKSNPSYKQLFLSCLNVFI